MPCLLGLPGNADRRSDVRYAVASSGGGDVHGGVFCTAPCGLGRAGGALPQTRAGGAWPACGGAASLGARRPRVARRSASRCPESAGSPTSGCVCWKGCRTEWRWRWRRHGSPATANRACTSRMLCSMFARSLARAEKGDVEECIVRLAAEMLEAREVSLWLQPLPARSCGRGRVGRRRRAPRTRAGDALSRPRSHSRSRSGPSHSCSNLRQYTRDSRALRSSAAGAASR